MLKLYWTPGPSLDGGEPGFPALADTLSADTANDPNQQSFARRPAAPEPLAGDLAARLDGWLFDPARPAGPVYVLVHGFQYDPSHVVAGNGGDDPFGFVYGTPGAGGPDARLSWLPLCGECDEQGGNRQDIAIAFAWVSEGTFSQVGLACWDNDYKLAALDLAPAAAQALAAVLARIGQHGLRARILAHSLGTRTTTQAIRLLQEAHAANPVERVVLLGGAEFGVDAAAIYEGCNFSVINVVSMRDAVLEIGAQSTLDPVRQNGGWTSYVIGRHGLGGNPQWHDIEISSGATRAALAALPAQYSVSAHADSNVHALDPALRHWVYYTNPGNRPLVRDLLTSGAAALATLLAGVPNGVNSAANGHFQGQDVPSTPGSCLQRLPGVAASRTALGGVVA